MAAKYPDFEDWKVQLAYNYTGKELRDGEWFSLSQKINGVRATTIDRFIVSRGGKIFAGLEHIEKELYQLKRALKEFDAQLEFDGELRIGDEYIGGMSDNEAFKISVGLANSSVNMIGKEKLRYIIFDAVRATDFINNACTITYRSRLEWLREFTALAIRKLNLKYIKIVPVVYSGTDKSQIDKWFNYANNQGWEGLMINRDMHYCYTRTKALLKIKKFDTLDLKIVGYTQGTGKYEHTLGALACKFRDNTVYVGTGFDDLTRDLLWEQRDHLEGKLCEVKYKDITYDKHTCLPSLQFPVFICIKEDKSKADA